MGPNWLVLRRVAALVALVVAWGYASGGAAEFRLAATANGQTVCRLDGLGRVISAFDADRSAPRRDIVGPAAAALPEFVALGCLPGDVVATVCRAADEWSLRTYRIEPGGAADAAVPLQVVPIGRANGPAAGVDLAVSHARGWLAIAGLPPPLPPVLRAAVAGVRVGPLSDRSCPVPAAGLRPRAAAVSPADELVLILGPSVPDGPADDQLAFYGPTGRELLRLETGLRGTLGIDFHRGDGTLWAVAADVGGRTGLWRLDAAVADGRQVVRPVLAAPFESPWDLACPSPRALVIGHGGAADRLAWIDPATVPAGGGP